MKIAICDDSVKDAEQIKHCCLVSALSSSFDYTIFHSGNKLISSLHDGNQFDIFFLDVDMPEISGIDVGKFVRSHNDNAIIIFITSYPEYAINAFECEAFNYVLKPCDPQRIEEILIRAVNRFGITHKYHKVKIRNQTIRILLSDIYYIECLKKHIIYHLKDEDIETTDKLSNVYDALCDFGFYQIHQGYIVNMDKIKSFNGYSVILDDGRSVMVSVRKKAETLIAYSKYVERFTR